MLAGTWTLKRPGMPAIFSISISIWASLLKISAGVLRNWVGLGSWAPAGYSMSFMPPIMLVLVRLVPIGARMLWTPKAAWLVRMIELNLSYSIWRFRRSKAMVWPKP